MNRPTTPTSRPLAETPRREVSELFRLVAAAVLPVLVFASAITALYGERQRNRVEDTVRERVADLSARLDAWVAAETRALDAVAASQNLDQPDLAAFQIEARRVVAATPNWASVVLLDPRSAVQLMSTRSPLGPGLPTAGDPESVFEAVRTRQPQVSSGIFRGATTGELLIAVRVPVIRDGAVRYVLSASMRPEILAGLFDRLSESWVGGLLDADHRLLAHSRGPQNTGKLATASLLEQLARARSGAFYAPGNDGTPYFTAFRQARAVPWTVVSGVPASEVDAARWHSLIVTGGAGVLTLIVAGAIALVLGRALTRRKRAEERLQRLEAENRVFEIGLRNRELERSQAALALSESRSRAIANNAADGILTLDDNGLIDSFNAAAERIFGTPRAEVIGSPASVLLAEPDRPLLAEMVEAHREHPEHAPSEREVTGRRRDGSTFPLELRIAGFAFRGQVMVAVTARDIGHRVQVEERARQSQRLEAVGQLTGGLAHDFNNLLTVVLGNLALIEEHASGEPVRRFAAAARRAAERGERLTRQLLSFGRRQLLRPKTVEVNAAIRQVEPLIRHSLGPGHELMLDLGADLWPAAVDESEFEVALLNLIVNARDAMPDGGRVAIRTRNCSEPVPDPADPEGSGGELVEILVADDGVGMTAEVGRRAFEPFFTTKEVGRGSGLGLSQVYGFVRQSGGEVTLDTAPGAGTRVAIRLPRAGPSGPVLAVPEPVAARLAEPSDGAA